MAYRTIWEPHGVVWVYSGQVTAEEIESANREFYGDPRSDRTRYQIIDTRQVDGVEWGDRSIKTTAAQDSGAERTLKNVKVAYVATDPEIVSMMEGYVEISKALNSSWTFQGFEDLESAREWVGP